MKKIDAKMRSYGLEKYQTLKKLNNELTPLSMNVVFRVLDGIPEDMTHYNSIRRTVIKNGIVSERQMRLLEA